MGWEPQLWDEGGRAEEGMGDRPHVVTASTPTAGVGARGPGARHLPEPPWDQVVQVVTSGISSAVADVPGAAGRRLPGPEPHLPRGVRGLCMLLQAGPGRSDQAAQLLLCHLDGGGGRPHLLVSAPCARRRVSKGVRRAHCPRVQE